jgi:hypothetical protein
MRHFEMLFNVCGSVDLWFCMETGKLWEPPHASFSDTTSDSRPLIKHCYLLLNLCFCEETRDKTSYFTIFSDTFKIQFLQKGKTGPVFELAPMGEGLV